MGLRDRLRDAIIDLLGIDQRYTNSKEESRLRGMALVSDYYYGHHKKPFRVKVNQPDDNLAINYTKLLINKGVAMLLGKGVTFELGEDQEVEQDYINTTWALNKKDVLLQDQAQYGAMYGTVYAKIDPWRLAGPDDKRYHRIIALNPLHWTIETEAEDIETVVRYIGRFNITGPGGKKVARRQTIERVLDESSDTLGDVLHWVITDEWFINGSWELQHEPVVWEYPFPPIIHWKNLPNAGDPYGAPDVDDNVIELQDRINFTSSNVARIIRYHAHPRTWARGTHLGNNATWGADELIELKGENAELKNLEMTSDLASSINFINMIRQALFDTSQTVDLASIKDKVGNITNLGLRVLYLDAEAKINSKRELWGEALTELNRRMLFIDGTEDASGGVPVWPDVIPVDQAAQTNEDSFELTAKLVSKRTIAERRGYDYDKELANLEDETTQGDAVNESILRAISGGA